MKSLIPTARDVRLLKLDGKRVLVVSCDSSGAIGSKALDLVKCPPEAVGKFTARVALMETFATGAKPICISGSLTVEPSPTGKRILRGIRSEMKYTGLSSHTPLVASAEKNFPVRQTGVGITAMGLANARSLRIGACLAGDELFALGLPHLGTEVLAGERRHLLADSRDIETLLKYDSVHEIIPVGSRGILEEVKVMARDSNLQFELAKDVKIDLRKSAGPATVTIFAGLKMQQPLARIRKPVARIGVFTGR